MTRETISVRLDRKTLTRLTAIAEATGHKRATLMSQAIERYAESEAWQIAAIGRSVDELERGQAELVDHEEVARWLKTWGTEGEAEP